MFHGAFPIMFITFTFSLGNFIGLGISASKDTAGVVVWEPARWSPTKSLSWCNSKVGANNSKNCLWYIYISIKRERDRPLLIDIGSCVFIYIYIYTYIYTQYLF